jgi:hypothetical protein
MSRKGKVPIASELGLVMLRIYLKCTALVTPESARSVSLTPLDSKSQLRTIFISPHVGPQPAYNNVITCGHDYVCPSLPSSSEREGTVPSLEHRSVHPCTLASIFAIASRTSEGDLSFTPPRCLAWRSPTFLVHLSLLAALDSPSFNSPSFNSHPSNHITLTYLVPFLKFSTDYGKSTRSLVRVLGRDHLDELRTS